jgi:hypothetical protein
MNAFIDKEGVLVAHGHMVSNNDDTLVVVQEGFNLTPGHAKFVNGVWLEHIPPVNHRLINGQEQAKLMNAVNAATLGHADAFILGLLSEEEAAAYKTWAIYKLALGKVDLSHPTPAWPEVPVT